MDFDLFSILVLVLLAVVVVVLGRIDRRAAKNERLLLAILNNEGIESADYPTPSAKVMAFLAHPADKIAAIKQYRLETGSGLKEAHDAIERCAARASAASD